MAEKGLKQQTKRGLYWKFAEQFSKYGIQFLIGIFMARLLSPTDYGITALPGVFIAVATIFVGAGFGTAMVRKPELKEEDLSTAFYYSTTVGIIAYIILFCTSPWIADFYNIPVLKSLVRVSALNFLFLPLVTPQNIILQRNLDFKTPAKISVICKIVSGIIGITMALYGYGVWALVISSTFSLFAEVVIKIYAVHWYPKTGWSKESFQYLWGYGNKLMASRLLDTLYNNITPVVIGKFYTPADLGVYNRAQSYAAMPSQQATDILQGVTFPVLSKMQDNDEYLAHNYRRILKVSAFVIFPAMMLLAALARPLVIVIISAKWESCIILLQIICFAMMWYPIHAINLNLLQVKGRSDWFLKLEIIKKIYGVIILAATLPFGLIVLCLGRILSSLISLVVNTHYTGILINCGFWTQMKDLFPTLSLSLAMFLIVWGITQVVPSMPLQIIIGGIVGITFYLGMSYILKMNELNDVKYMLKRK